MNREELKQILPHREPMLLLDTVEKQVENGEEIAIGAYQVRGEEWFLQGHFPENPIVPGVIQCEILAQSVCVLLTGALNPGCVPMYTGMKQVKFRNPVRPGDLFQTRCKITRSHPPFYFAEGKGYVGETLCIEAEFSFAVVEQ